MSRSESVFVRTETHVPAEIVFAAQCSHAKPFDDVILDVQFTDPAGQTRRVPAFWASFPVVTHSRVGRAAK